MMVGGDTVYFRWDDNRLSYGGPNIRSGTYKKQLDNDFHIVISNGQEFVLHKRYIVEDADVKEYLGTTVQMDEVEAAKWKKALGIPLPASAYHDNNPKTAIGVKKMSTHAIPPIAILKLGQAMANGEGKYGLFNWRTKKVTGSVYDDAIMRHLLAWRDGEDVADDSGVEHLAHIMASCAIMLDAIASGTFIDDRGHKGMAPKIMDEFFKKASR